MNIDSLIDIRRELRELGNYQMCDRIRNYLDTKNVFVFDTKHGQEVYFEVKPTTRKEIEKRIQQESKANRLFDAWLYTVNNKLIINK